MHIESIEAVEARESIARALTEIIADMTRDWESAFAGEVGPDTQLISDLGFGSIDVVQLVVAIEERFGRRDLPLQELLMKDGRYIDELTVGRVVEFLEENQARA